MSVTLHTDLGDIKVEVFCEECPMTAENFLALCASGYYDGCIFHRNIKGFMVQTGDPSGSGKGGSSIWGGKFKDEFHDDLRRVISLALSVHVAHALRKHNKRGMVSMANNGTNTNGSQFFFTYAKQQHLDMKYTVFAKVIDGFDTLDALEAQPVSEKGFRPLSEVKLSSVTIQANPIADRQS